VWGKGVVSWLYDLSMWWTESGTAERRLLMKRMRAAPSTSNTVREGVPCLLHIKARSRTVVYLHFLKLFDGLRGKNRFLELSRNQAWNL
jgi:hypothetical protein